MLGYFAQTRVIVVSFIVFVLLYLAFAWVHAGVGDGPLLDILFTGEAARARIAEMSPDEIRVHLIGTATLDMLYPFAYGILFAGIIYRFGGVWGQKLALLPLIALALDLSENLVQISALAGGPDLLGIKLVLTGPKFIAALASMLFAIVLLLVALLRFLRKPAGG